MTKYDYFLCILLRCGYSKSVDGVLLQYFIFLLRFFIICVDNYLKEAYNTIKKLSSQIIRRCLS